MKDPLLQRLTGWIWSALVFAVVLLALYVSLGRYLTENVSQYQQGILREINARLPFQLEVDELHGSWQSFTPRLELQGVRIPGDAHAPIALELATLEIEFDMLASLRQRSVLLFGLVGTGAKMHLELGADGQMSLPGVPITPGGNIGDQLGRFVFNTERLQFDDVRITVHGEGGIREVHTSMQLLRDADFRRFKMSLLSPSQQSWFRAVAEGNGLLTDFETFTGNIHMEFSVSEVELYSELAGLLGLELLQGQLQSEVWLSLDNGAVRAAADFSASDLELSLLAQPDGKVLDLDQLAATVRSEYRNGVWIFGAQDVMLSDGDYTFPVDTMQGRYDGGSLRLVSSALDLHRLRDYVLHVGALPDNLATVVSELAPGGHLDRMALEISDLPRFAQSWRFSGNFRDFSVQSWRGAPGITNAAGYLEVSPNEGRLQVQSSDFSMHFPKLFEQALSYSDFAAELEWYLAQDSFHLVSGPFTATGEEGAVQGLFSLDFPLVSTPQGVEMGLMVGFSEADPRYRDKYLPYTLSPALLDWLEPSINGGTIVDGGFIFRGSLRPGATDYKTVQLYLDAVDTTLLYHPDWPPLLDVSGVVVVDDALVDVAAPSGRLYSSAVSDIAVRLSPGANGELMLDLSGHIEGSAADGLALVNNSPLRARVGDVFTDWQLDGGLTTKLELRLDLRNLAQPPLVQVHTRWDAVDMQTGKLRLPLDAVSGELLFSDSQGFSAQNFEGELWGQPVSATVRQGVRAGRLATLDVEFNTKVYADPLRQWLDLDLMRFASGGAAVTAHILVPPTGEARLQLSSRLQGVGLDLPTPFGKTPGEQSTLRVELPLVNGSKELLLRLQDEVYLTVGLGDAGYEGASLGFAAALPLTQPKGSFILGGELSLLNLEQWLQFGEDYLGYDLTGSGDQPSDLAVTTSRTNSKVEVALEDSGESNPDSTGAVSKDADLQVTALQDRALQDRASQDMVLQNIVSQEAVFGLSPVAVLAARDLQVGEMLAFGQRFEDVTLDVEQLNAGWRAEFSTSWLAGDVRFPEDFSRADIALSLLDIAGFEQMGDSLEAADPAALVLPDLSVSIAELRRGDALWGDLSFKLRDAGLDYHASEIRGNLRGLELGVEEGLTLDWLASGETQQTHLKGRVSFLNFGDVLREYGVEQVVETNSGAVDLDLGWSGSPLDFSLIETRGSMTVAVDEGRFLKAPGGSAGTLKVVGIMNLAEFVRRLSLDISYIFQSGIPFDSVTGEVLFHAGQIEVPQMDVLGRSSRFQFVGMAEIEQQTISGELVATLPVASNLPWVAALISGLPAAAGIYVISKLFTRQMDRFSSASYSINGPWDEPEVNFERIFDNTAEQRRAAAREEEQVITAPPQN